MPPKLILFVDDEPRVFQELEKSLQAMRDEWQVRFAPSGSEALKILAREPFDAVVSDMLMPEMNGAQFLTEIKTRHSQIMRFALLGDSEAEAVLRLSCPAHQCLSKPLNLNLLRNTIRRTLTFRDLLTNEKLCHMVSQVQSLPGLPFLYVELLGELQKAEPSMTRVSEIIGRDMGMTGKILHMVNSVFYSLTQKITDPGDAAMYSRSGIVESPGADTPVVLTVSTAADSRVFFGGTLAALLECWSFRQAHCEGRKNEL